MTEQPLAPSVDDSKPTRNFGKWRQMTGAAFLAQGLAGVTQKTLAELSGEYRVFYLFCTYIVAAALSYGLFRQRQARITRPAIVIGMISGVTCVLSVYFVLGALKQLGGVVVFSAVPAAALMLTLLAGRVIFKERLSRLQTAGVFLALLGIVLVQLGSA